MFLIVKKKEKTKTKQNISEINSTQFKQMKLKKKELYKN